MTSVHPALHRGKNICAALRRGGKNGGKNSLGSESLGAQSCSFHEL